MPPAGSRAELRPLNGFLTFQSHQTSSPNITFGMLGVKLEEGAPGPLNPSMGDNHINLGHTTIGPSKTQEHFFENFVYEIVYFRV